MTKDIVAGAILITIISSGAGAHSWYDRECCHDQDCHPVPANEIVQLDGGKYRWKQFVFQKADVKPSRDGRYHVCVWADVTPLCIYVPLFY